MGDDRLERWVADLLQDARDAAIQHDWSASQPLC